MSTPKKNIQIIDGALNSAYDIFRASDALFDFIFPNGTDIAFIEDLLDRGIPDEINAKFREMWENPVNKKKVFGIHGTLFYELREIKSEFYPNRQEFRS